MENKINRGVLYRKALAGKLLGKCKYHLTDDYLSDKSNNYGIMDNWIPVEINEQQGIIGKLTLKQWDFKTKGGFAYQDEKGIHLHIHSNLVYILKEK